MEALPLVLLVDDSTMVTDALRVLFESTGHRVAVAADVSSAIDACAVALVDVMLLDLSLGSEDGLDVLPVVREAGTAPRVTYAMTGHDDPATRRRCLDAGCRDVLVKPVPTRELLRRVSEAAGGDK